MVNECSLLLNARNWVERERSIRSAVLFGSRARRAEHIASADDLSDIDLHLIVVRRQALEGVNWTVVFPGLRLLMETNRAATGAARKLTLTFKEGQIDLVMIPLLLMQVARLGMLLGLHRRSGALANSLNAMATIMSGGYLFLKGEKQWSAFYAQVLSEMPGVRISDCEAITLANHFFCDYLQFHKRVRRGEYIAAQRMLHLTLAEKNILLLHELRLRNRLLTFQQARRIEFICGTAELEAVRVNARLTGQELSAAGSKLGSGFCALMEALVPEWEPPAALQQHFTPAPRIVLQ